MATATLRQGNFIDQYKIEDSGGEFDNHLIFISFQVTDVVYQTSSLDTETFKTSLLCWEDPDLTECPDDIIDIGPPIVYREPIIKFLDDIMAAGGVTVGADLTDLAEKSIYLAFWHEYRTAKVITDSIAEMVTEGLNDNQQKRALKYIYFGLGIDFNTSKTIADARINSSTVANYDDYNLATVPLQDRRLLILFGDAAWFD